MKIIRLDEVDSTNSYLTREAQTLQAPVMVVADSQTAGRGQRGNSWESIPGENLTFSVLFRPVEFRAVEQFSISEATALAVVDFLANYGIKATVKWPNDIYVGDKKICGILIQHSLTGCEISYSILGIGVNINQAQFFSDAPNPVSLKQITGQTYNLANMANEISECIERRLGMIYGSDLRMNLHNEFMSNLWRGDGEYYPFIDTASGEKFDAAIDGIALDGVLTLRLGDDSIRSYRFKEVMFCVE